MEPERLEDRLKRLERERQAADRIYNERLTAVDQSLLQAPEFPHPPPPYDDSQITPINDAWRILPDGPPPSDRSLKGRLRSFVWRLVGPPLLQQQAFNAALVDHLNRNVAAHREAERAITTTIALIQAQTTALARFQSMLLQLLQSVTLYVDTKDRSVGGQIHVLNGAISALTDDWLRHWETLRTREVRREAQNPVLRAAYDDLSKQVALVQQATMLLKREVERLAQSGTTPAHAEGAAVATPAPLAPALSTMSYVGFEDRFRGSQEDIAARLADYVPLFAGADNVVDLGCGRGELLGLLRDAGIQARGIDLNQSMVEVCRERGLRADAIDAVGFLDQQADASLGGLIAVQVVEHLEPAYLSRLIELAFHKLKPGARLVFETINPACWTAFFESYIRDVTHRWPLHPDTLHYLVQAGGFSTVEIQYRSPTAVADRLPHVARPVDIAGRPADPALIDFADAINEHADKLNARLFTHMDYALVAQR